MSSAVRRSTKWTYFTVALLLSAPLFASAQEAVYTPAPNTLLPGTVGCGEPCNQQTGFSARFIPYAWAPSMKGDLTVRGETAKVDIGIDKTLDLMFSDLNFGFLGQVEANYGNFGVLVNGMYMSLSLGGEIKRIDFSTKYTQTILDTAFTYELSGLSESLWAGSRLELLAGIRYNSLTGGLTLTGEQGRRVEARGSQDWVDPIIGTRVRLPYNDCWTFTARGDIGGFGLGKASQFTWNIELMAEYRCSERCSLIGGWRWLDINYENGSGSMKFAYDMLLSGPVLGLAINF